jgi:mono/diheme cytochrome c family protein
VSIGRNDRRWAWLAWLALWVALSGCSGCASYRRCNAPPEARLAALPALLSETGLFAAGSLDALGSGVRAYAPGFELWSDGATKRRWVSLPAGGRIDSADMDDWSFPVGTRFYKEFSVAGRRIETRLLIRVGQGAGDWAGAAYVWDADQREARLSPQGGQDVGGSGHDVPSATDCIGCHGGRRSYVLGFSAVQLAQPGVPLSLDALASEGRLTRVPARAVSMPGAELDRAALGYLHANCGHCHNPRRPPRGDGPRCYDPERSLEFWLPSASSAELWQTPALRTAVPRFVTPGEPDDSRLLTLVSRRGRRLHMPPLGSGHVDEAGVRRLSAWIASLRAVPGATSAQETPAHETPETSARETSARETSAPERASDLP